MNDTQSMTKHQPGAAIATAPARDESAALVPSFGTRPPLTMKELQFFGSMVHEAGLIPKEQGMQQKQLEARAMAKIVAGHAYGFDPVLSIRAFDVINGKIQPTSECVAILIKRSGKYNFKPVEWTETVCDLVFYEKGEKGWTELGHSRFSIEDAKRAGYTTGGNRANWEKIPRNMLLARAITNGKKLYCADVMDPGGYFDNAGNGVTEAVDIDPAIYATEPQQIAAGQTIDAEHVETLPTGERVDTATGEVIDIEPEPAEDADAKAEREAISAEEPLFSGGEENLVDLRTAAADAYNSCKGEARKRANDWLGDKTLGTLDARELKGFIDAFANM